MGVILLVFNCVFDDVACFCWFGEAGGGLALAPLWLCATREADFVHFACMFIVLLVLGAGGGLALAPLWLWAARGVLCSF